MVTVGRYLTQTVNRLDLLKHTSLTLVMVGFSQSKLVHQKETCPKYGGYLQSGWIWIQIPMHTVPYHQFSTYHIHYGVISAQKILTAFHATFTTVPIVWTARWMLCVFPTAVYTVRTVFKFDMFHTVFFVFHTMVPVTIIAVVLLHYSQQSPTMSSHWPRPIGTTALMGLDQYSLWAGWRNDWGIPGPLTEVWWHSAAWIGPLPTWVGRARARVHTHKSVWMCRHAGKRICWRARASERAKVCKEARGCEGVMGPGLVKIGVIADHFNVSMNLLGDPMIPAPSESKPWAVGGRRRVYICHMESIHYS